MLSFVGRVGFSLGLVDRARPVLRRGVDRVEPKVDLAGVHKVVACSSRDLDQSVDGDGALLAGQYGLTFALDEDERLIHVIVDFLADVTARGMLITTT
jgi:hypothetical protein